VEGLEDRLCPSQYLLVSDFAGDQILRYDGTDGHFIDTFVPKGTGGSHAMEYMFLDSSGQNILVDGSDTNNILRFSLVDGSPVPGPRQSGASLVRKGAGGLVTPEGLVYDPDGNVLVANQTTASGNILKYDPFTGQFLGVFLDAGAGDDLSHANDMHIGPDGDLYVSSYKGATYNNGNLLRFDPVTGAPLPGPGRTGANFIDPLSTQLANAFAWGPDGNLYLSVDAGSNVNGPAGIDRFDGTTGDPLPAQGQTGAVFVPPGSGGVGFIDSIKFGDDGNLYAADAKGAVRKYDGTTGDSLGDFVAPGSGGLGNAGGLFFYDQPTTAEGNGSHHQTQAKVVLGNPLPPTPAPGNPLGAEGSTKATQASVGSPPVMTEASAQTAGDTGSSATPVFLVHSQNLTDPLAPLSSADPTLGTQNLLGLS
jgi:sugar lactone lactonase YvrE